MKILQESGKTQRPEKVFRWRQGLYIYDQSSVKSFDKKGNPILKYELGTATPKNGQLPFETDSNYKISAGMLDQIFHRGEIKAVVAGAWKANPKLDLTQMLLYLGLGGTIGYIICLVVNHVSGV